MKKSTLFLGAVLALLLTGCGAKPYVDVKSDDYATLQLVPNSKTLMMTDEYGAHIFDYTKGCDFDQDNDYLGLIETDSDTPSRVVKIPVETPQIIKVYYTDEGLNSSHTIYTMYVLTPEKNKHYVVNYMRKEIDFFNTLSEFDVYVQDGDKKVDVPSSRLREYNYEQECK